MLSSSSIATFNLSIKNLIAWCKFSVSLWTTVSLYSVIFFGCFLFFNNGYFPTPLDIVIITEFSYWLWEHIFVSFPKEKKKWRFRILSNSSFLNHCGHFMAASTKKVRNIKYGHWKFSQLNFSIIFGRDTTIKEEEGRSWHKRLCFQTIPPPLPYHPIKVSQQVQTLFSFQNNYLGKGVE